MPLTLEEIISAAVVFEQRDKSDPLIGCLCVAWKSDLPCGRMDGQGGQYQEVIDSLKTFQPEEVVARLVAVLEAAYETALTRKAA